MTNYTPKFMATSRSRDLILWREDMLAPYMLLSRFRPSVLI